MTFRSATSLTTDQQKARSAGRYEVYEEFARGGMGAIHQARDRYTSRLVAYKRMIPPNERTRARATALFRREYETLARLPHPNIVQVYDYGLDEAGPFYAMELLPGDDLTKSAPLGVRDACRVVRDVASALALVHARRLVHRDVSPSNVRLSAEGRAKLLDFGALTPFGRAREIVGTPVCIAPECLAGGELDARVDLYALGAVAYWVLTRRAHLRASNMEELARALEEPTARPSSHSPAIPAQLDDLIMALLARDPLARPDNAATVIEAVTVIGDLAEETDARAVAFSYLARPPLVGRDEALASAKECIDRGVAGRSSNLLLQAERELGTSAVLEDAALYAQSLGANVVRLRGDVGAESFSTARTLIEMLSLVDPDLQQRALGREATPSILAKEVRSRVGSALQTAEQHAAILGAAQSMVFEAARALPLLLFIDDFDRVDEASASLFASLASVASTDAECSLAIIAAATADDREESVVVRLFRNHASVVRLQPLSLEQLSTLIRGVFGPIPNATGFARSLHNQSGGRPAFAMDLVRFLLERGTISYVRGTFILPHDVSKDLLDTPRGAASVSRLAAVGEDARAVASALALHGHPLQLEQLGAALALSVSRIILAVEELVRAGLVVTAEQNVSPLSCALGASVVATLSDADKRALHERLALALSASAAAPEQYLAASSHFLSAGLVRRAIETLGPVMDMQYVAGPAFVPWVGTLETLLSIFKRQRRRKEQCLKLMFHLINAGFFGDLSAQTRHIDLTLQWMSSVSGMAAARRLRRFVGPKLALLFGLVHAGLRRAFTPKRERLGTVPQVLDMFSRLVSVAVAAAASALDAATALRAASFLQPFAVLPPHTAGSLLREFCFAACELTTGDIDRALARYEALLPVFREPVKGLHDEARHQFYLGCLNGLAQGGLWRTSPRVLEVASELASDPFFAPHAQSARMFYHAYRGERDQAEAYRSALELAALQGGTSWSAMVLASAHAGLVATRTRDPVALIQTISEQRRLASVAPSLSLTADICEAWLEHLRGNSELAAQRYESILAGRQVQRTVSRGVIVANYASVLCSLGRFEEAKRECSSTLDGETDPARVPVVAREVLSSLALAEAGLGNFEVARELMERVLRDAEREDNPLRTGNAHRDRALIALSQRDAEAFEAHYCEAERLYRQTKHPALIMQLDGLLVEAEHLGLRERSSRRALDTPASEEFDGETTLELGGAQTAGSGSEWEITRRPDSSRPRLVK